MWTRHRRGRSAQDVPHRLVARAVDHRCPEPRRQVVPKVLYGRQSGTFSRLTTARPPIPEPPAMPNWGVTGPKPSRGPVTGRNDRMLPDFRLFTIAQLLDGGKPEVPVGPVEGLGRSRRKSRAVHRGSGLDHRGDVSICEPDADPWLTHEWRADPCLMPFELNRFQRLQCGPASASTPAGGISREVSDELQTESRTVHIPGIPRRRSTGIIRTLALSLC